MYAGVAFASNHTPHHPQNGANILILGISACKCDCSWPSTKTANYGFQWATTKTANLIPGISWESQPFQLLCNGRAAQRHIPMIRWMRNSNSGLLTSRGVRGWKLVQWVCPPYRPLCLNGHYVLRSVKSVQSCGRCGHYVVFMEPIQGRAL